MLEIVIPCYNEESNLNRLLELLKELHQINFVLVDNGSTDASWELLQRNTAENIRVIHCPQNLGYGGGILAGLANCSADYVGWMHADLQTNPECLLDAVQLLQPNRVIKGRRYGRGLADKHFTIGMSVIESLLFGTKLWDINAQPTLFPRKWFTELRGAPSDFSLDLFTFVQARRRKLDIVRFDVFFGPRFSGMSTWNHGLKSRFKFIQRTLQYSIHLRRQL